MVLETVLDPSPTGVAERRRIERHAPKSTLGVAHRDAAAGVILSMFVARDHTRWDTRRVQRSFSIAIQFSKYIGKTDACKPCVFRMGERRGSNPFTPAPQAGAVPVWLRSPEKERPGASARPL
jgi:hypothetical protein